MKKDHPLISLFLKRDDNIHKKGSSVIQRARQTNIKRYGVCDYTFHIQHYSTKLYLINMPILKSVYNSNIPKLQLELSIKLVLMDQWSAGPTLIIEKFRYKRGISFFPAISNAYSKLGQVKKRLNEPRRVLRDLDRTLQGYAPRYIFCSKRKGAGLLAVAKYGKASNTPYKNLFMVHFRLKRNCNQTLFCFETTLPFYPLHLSLCVNQYVSTHFIENKAFLC